MTTVPGALLSGAELTASSVVANNAMNRQRGLTGVNSYRRELGFNPVDVMRDRLAAPWTDRGERTTQRRSDPPDRNVGRPDLTCPSTVI